MLVIDFLLVFLFLIIQLLQRVIFGYRLSQFLLILGYNPSLPSNWRQMGHRLVFSFANSIQQFLRCCKVDLFGLSSIILCLFIVKIHIIRNVIVEHILFRNLHGLDHFFLVIL